MPMPGTVLYHLTENKNRFSVLENGLLISKDARKKGRIWLCEFKELRDIAEHICRKDKHSFMIYTIVEVQAYQLETYPKKCGRPGIFYVDQDISPKNISVIPQWLTVDARPGDDPRRLAEERLDKFARSMK